MTLFDGPDLTPEDDLRLGRQLATVRDAMSDGKWHDPEELERLTGFRWASISARLRDLRKPRFGGHAVERTNAGNGNFAYRLVLRNPQRSLF